MVYRAILVGIVVCLPNAAFADAPEITLGDSETETVEEVIEEVKEAIRVDRLVEVHPAATPVPDSVPVIEEDQAREIKRVLKKSKPTARHTILQTELGDRRIKIKHAKAYLALLPKGHERVHSAVHLYLRVDQRERFNKLFGMFNESELEFLGDKMSTLHLDPSLARVRIEVVNAEGEIIDGARVFFCDQGPLPAPAEEMVPTALHREGCELEVWVGPEKIYTEDFVPTAEQRFARRVTIEADATEPTAPLN